MPVEEIETVSLSRRMINCQAVRTCGVGDLVAVTLEIQSAALPSQEGCSEGRLVARLPGVKLPVHGEEVLSVRSAGVGGWAWVGLVTTKVVLETLGSQNWIRFPHRAVEQKRRKGGTTEPDIRT